MRPSLATMILLPVAWLFCTASWAATLGGLEGECILQDGGKQVRMMAVVDDEI